LLVVLLASLAGLMSVLNREPVNNVLFPIAQYLPMFELMWGENPRAALSVMIDKSVLAFGHFDSRSGLYLWTLEFDMLSLLVYAAVCVFVASTWRQHSTRPLSRGRFLLLMLGFGALLVARTYATVLAHCAGPTWVGFVALYALGFDTFSITPLWQWLLAATAAGMILGSKLSTAPVPR
jgi:hypothetical protein